MMRRLYSLLTYIVSPLAFGVVLWRGLRDRSYRAGWAERFGGGASRSGPPCIWLHAVSLGEITAAATLVRALQVRHPQIPLVVTTSTPTGRARAEALFGTGKGSGVDADAGAGSRVGADADAGSGVDADAGAGSRVGAGADASSGVDADAGAGSRVGAGADASSGVGAGVGNGVVSGAGTGMAVGSDAAIDIRYLPYDTPRAVGRFMTRIGPRLAIIMETELWPNLFGECRRRGVPVVLASARLSAKSVSRYLRLRALFGGVFAGNVWIAAQTAEDAGRFIAIGASADRTRVTGNLKFDMQIGAATIAQGRELRLRQWSGRAVWIAGSTHAGEEEQVLVAHAALQAGMADALLLLVPRHPNRFDSVAELLTRQGVRFERRSSGRALAPGTSVLLVDTVGELAALYAAADAAFVGGSLVPVGGHNLLEPAALGVPVITGPYNANGREIARLLLQCGAARQVADGLELGAVLREFFADPPLRVRAGEIGRQVVEMNRGSLERLLGLIDPLLAPAPAPAAGVRPDPPGPGAATPSAVH